MKILRRLFGKANLDEDASTNSVEANPGQETTVPHLTAPETAKDQKSPKDRLPRFRASAADRTSPTRERSEFAVARMKLRDVFTPAQPVTQRNLFAGRLDVLANLIEIIEERLSHVVLFGERGMGKTSLLHILSGLAEESRYLVLRATCGANSRFDDMFRALLEDIPLLYSKSISPTDEDDASERSLAELLPEGSFDARQLSDVLAEVTGTRILILVDEYDRIQSEPFRLSVAELIKNLSDQAAPVQLVITGVSANLHELIGYIPSIRRNVIGVSMPRLSYDEAASLVAMGEKAANLRFDKPVVEMIHALANGSPYLTRLICHHASLLALAHERYDVRGEHIESALDRIVEEAEGRLSLHTIQRVQRLDIKGNSECYGAIAKVASNPDGWFAESELQSRLGSTAKFKQALKLISVDLAQQGLMIIEETDIEPRYRFVDEGLPNYIWMSVARHQFRSKSLKAA